MTDNVLEENDLIIYKDLQEKKSSKTYIVCNSNYNKTENSKYNYESASLVCKKMTINSRKSVCHLGIMRRSSESCLA